jgi:hypothetical protein
VHIEIRQRPATLLVIAAAQHRSGRVAMTELSYRLSEEFLDPNDSGSGLIAVIWLILYLVLIATAINTPGLSSMSEIAAALSA